MKKTFKILFILLMSVIFLQSIALAKNDKKQLKNQRKLDFITEKFNTALEDCTIEYSDKIDRLLSSNKTDPVKEKQLERFNTQFEKKKQRIVDKYSTKIQELELLIANPDLTKKEIKRQIRELNERQKPSLRPTEDTPDVEVVDPFPRNKFIRK